MMKVIQEQVNNVDMVNHPSHYTNSNMECIDAIKEITKPLQGFEAYLIGTILKYLWRFKLKNGLEDLEKAQWYLDKLIKEIRGENNEH